MIETTRQRLAFDLYVKLGGERSLDALYATIRSDPSIIGMSRAPTHRTIEGWSSGCHWQDRVAELEREAAVEDHEDQVRVLREMNDRHAKEGLALQQKAVERLHTLPADELTPADAVRALVEGVRLERLARGEFRGPLPDEREVEHGQLQQFSDEELRRLVEIADAGATGASATQPG